VSLCREFEHYGAKSSLVSRAREEGERKHELLVKK
jgi:hypothetical protein